MSIDKYLNKFDTIAAGAPWHLSIDTDKNDKTIVDCDDFYGEMLQCTLITHHGLTYDYKTMMVPSHYAVAIINGEF